MMPSFDEFLRESLANGFDEVRERAWPAKAVVETHRHPFAVDALVVQGEMWLTVAGETRHLVPGDTFVLARDQAHAERYGESGATYWVARRN
jgi:quercetin dioxygenase-like cupin family protein